MTFILSLFLGLVQGIARFLPVSSSGHLSILQNLFNMEYSKEENLMFDALVNLGTLCSICFVYRTEIRDMITDGLEFMRMRGEADVDEPVVLKPPGRALLFVLIGTLPMLIALIFKSEVDRLFSNTAFVGFALLVTGGLLFVSDKFIVRGNKSEKTMTVVDAIIIGLSQAVAILPGLSRSGTTITVGLARGLSAAYAVRFSLLLSVPAVFGATIVSLYSAIRDGSDFSLFFIYLAGAIVATLAGFFSIQLLRRLMTRGSFGKFAYYCWGAGLVTILLSAVLSG